MTQPKSVGIDDIVVAAARLEGRVTRTSLLRSALIDARTGLRVLFKPECLQQTGSFKFRGALNAIAGLDKDAAARGVVAFSSGNHAQGVAAAAALRGVSAKIVMPADAPRIKLDHTAALGGSIIIYDRIRENRKAIAEDIAATEGRSLIPPYDHVPVMAGQGTTGLEIADAMSERGQTPDHVICPCGGGGLMAGLAVAMKSRFPEVRIWAAEPVGYDDTRRSLESGRRETADTSVPSICDALLAPSPGVETFRINRRLLSGGVTVTEAEVIEAMRTAFSNLHVVVEPGGAVALAALLANRLPVGRGQTVIVVLSGGNVDRDTFRRLLGDA